MSSAGGIDMEIDIKSSKVIITKTLKESETYKIVNRSNFQSISFYQKPDWVKGYSSMCGDSRHILLLDYDNVSYQFVISELRRLITVNKLTNFYVFVSRESDVNGQLIGNYHAVCLSKFLPYEAKKIIGQSHCDYAFRSMPLRKPYRCWVLRISGKGDRTAPEYKDVVVSEYDQRVISTAHKKLLEKLFNIKIVGSRFKEDGLDDIYIHDYQTANRLEAEK